MNLDEISAFAGEEAKEAMAKVERANRALREGVTKLRPPPIPRTHSVAEPVRQEVTQLKDMAGRKVLQASEQFHAGLPLIERAGYRLTALEIEIGITPKLVPRFAIRRHISHDEQKSILAEARTNRLLHGILTAMFKANEVQRYIKVGAMEFTELVIELGTLPKVRMRFIDRRENDVVRDAE